MFNVLRQSNNIRFYGTKPSLELKSINKILIANRGEIACRVVRTARKLGLRTVAIYSEADENALHTQFADEAYCVGEAPSANSYLRANRIIEVAKQSNCQAIHPGYGFLSESLEFADLCHRNHLIFIGPPSTAIRDMGIKSTSKAIMSSAGVPIINGYHGNDQADERLKNEAKKIGFPLMIKAVRGGGGKGMRIAEGFENFEIALNSARMEAQKSFGDNSVLLERYVRAPRHVEVQIFADQYGEAVYLWERDCSVQRRHQKIIEEAPAPGLSEDLRHELGKAAVRAAKAVGYVGAGTVEFIMDKEDLSFHFMEMNTRLQVEHPISEMITGIDLVEWQIRIAGGEPLPLKQQQISRKGHAFEARIYAENPRGGFMPGAGPLSYLTTPQPSDRVRIETGVQEGDEVSVHYDPMIAKLVVWGENRVQALNSLTARLTEYHISGLETNINFLIDLARHPQFLAGNVHTGFIEEHYESLFPPLCVRDEDICKAIIILTYNEIQSSQVNCVCKNDPFAINTNLRLNYDLLRQYHLKVYDISYKVDVKHSNETLEIKINDKSSYKVKFQGIKDSENRLKILCNINGQLSTCIGFLNENEINIFSQDGKIQFHLEQPKYLRNALDHMGGGGDSKVRAPMPGVLEKVLVKPGEKVKKGDNLVVLIAMKMEHSLKAPKDGIIKSIAGCEGSNVVKGATVVTFEEDE